jgi:hypothetical protein
MLKCTGTNVSEVAVPGSAEKVGMFTATLTPVDGGSAIRVVGSGTTVVATMAYGKLYEIVEATAPAQSE